ncbi:MAG: TCP-1/cpn60 chaperonin family protein [Thermoflexales bacterium]
MKSKKSAPRPGVIFHPDLLAGFNLIAEAVKPTLGPLARKVGVEANMPNRTPEMLDDAGTIARRILQFADPGLDAGAMLLRHALWRMREQCGDGSATLAVIAQAMLRQAAQAVAAGAHPALLRRGIELGVARATQLLRAVTEQIPPGVGRRALLASLAGSLCSDETLRDVLVEVVDILGPDGAIHVENANDLRVERDFVEGALWDSPWLAGGFATETGNLMGRVEDAAVVLMDGSLDNPANVCEGLGRLHGMGVKHVVLLASDLSDDARAVLLQARQAALFTILPIKTPGLGGARVVGLQDLATLTGARILFGDSAGFAGIASGDLGEARRAWVTARQFGIIGGRRDPLALRARIRAARQRLEVATEPDELAELRLRAGRLQGGLAVVRVGAVTARHQQARKEEAIRLASALQMAARRGVVPGGGAALFHIGVALRAAATGHSDEAWGMRCVAIGLEAPLAAIVANAGFDAAAIAGLLRSGRASQRGRGFDVRQGRIVDMRATGILDSAETVERAIRVAGSVVGMAVTTDALVLRRAPPTASHP